MEFVNSAIQAHLFDSFIGALHQIALIQFVSGEVHIYCNSVQDWGGRDQNVVLSAEVSPPPVPRHLGFFHVSGPYGCKNIFLCG